MSLNIKNVHAEGDESHKSRTRDKKSWKSGDQWSIENRWTGTTIMYTARGKESFGLCGDYEIGYQTDEEPEDVRAARLAKRARGKKVADIGDDKLSDQLVVVFGAEMSATSAVETLEALIHRIKAEGLCIGRPKLEDDFWYEDVEGS
jgi:hypothetical protein